MKQVWQTEDGTIFLAEEGAKQWEEEQSNRSALEHFLIEHCWGLDADTAHEVSIALSVHYNVTPK